MAACHVQDGAGGSQQEPVYVGSQTDLSLNPPLATHNLNDFSQIHVWSSISSLWNRGYSFSAQVTIRSGWDVCKPCNRYQQGTAPWSATCFSLYEHLNSVPKAQRPGTSKGVVLIWCSAEALEGRAAKERQRSKERKKGNVGRVGLLPAFQLCSATFISFIF